MALKETSEDSFQSDVIEAAEPVLVDFGAAWCGPCRQIAPALEELSAEFEGKISIYKIDVDDNPDIAGKYGIRSMPTLMIFIGGEPVATLIGQKSKSEMASWIESTISRAAA